MKNYLYNISRFTAFTLVELIIVIAVISILAGVVVVAINPAAMFQNARNSQRNSDISTIHGAISRYLADSPVNGIVRTLSNTITNYGATSGSGAGAAANNTLISGTCGLGSASNSTASCTAGSTSGLTGINGTGGAYSNTPIGACPGGSSGTGLVAGSTLGYLLKTSAVITTQEVDLMTLVNAGYLPRVPKDPFATSPSSGYRMCIDTSNPSTINNNTIPGKLVIFAPGIEAGANIPYLVI